MVKVCVGYQHSVDSRQVTHTKARMSQPLQNEDPLSEVRVDDQILAPDLK